ncbi:ommochrome-binding protein-like, partial [Ostrinia furnacalis]|uniref:ommochrome-binding protein-like n=1 Tax=Ostrinia furnacalis TaxID=93504 RepID=UPI00103C032B
MLSRDGTTELRHKSSNTLFFSYSLPDTYSDVDFQLAYIDLDTRESEIIAGIRGGCTVAIDQGNDEIYLGGSDGIYKYNMLTKLADNYKEKGRNIWSLYFRANLFYISYPDQKLYIDVDGKFIRVSEFEHFEVDNFHVMPNNDIYFANKSGLYFFDNLKLTIETVNELVTVRQIVEDNDGRLYVCTNFGILLRGGNEFTKVLDLKGIYGLAFDKDNNFIMSDEKNIVKLVHSDGGC